jgi:hypothetical protein
MTVDLSNLNVAKKQLEERQRALLETIEARQTELKELQAQLGRAAQEFERQLELKDEQFNMINEKLAEEIAKRAQMSSDAEYFASMELKWRGRLI